VTIHVGILGAGNISHTHAMAASAVQGVKVAAVYGLNLQRAEKLGKEFDAAVYANLETFLAHTPLDLVAIGSPSGVHADHGIAVARRGLHVLVEKPLDVTLERAEALIAEAKRAKVKLGVFFQDRAKPDLIKLKKLIERGDLGRPILATAHVKWYREPAYYKDSRWRGTLKLDGGGALMNQAIHTADLLLWLLGDVQRVSAKTATAFHRIEVEDTAVAILEFRSGALATFEAATSAFPGYKRRVEITGTEGTIIVEQDRIVAADLRKAQKDLVSPAGSEENQSATSPVISDARAHQGIIEDFIQAIRTDTNPACDGVEGRRSVALVRAAYESSEEGRAIAPREWRETVQP